MANLICLNDLHPCLVVRFAKERRLRIWRDYVAPTANLDQKDKQFVAKVSHSRHLEMHNDCCQALDNTEIGTINQKLKHFISRLASGV